MKSPRLTSVKEYFDDVGRLRIQVPNKPVEASQEFFAQSAPEMLRYYQLFRKNLGDFYPHYLASVPFITEELLRLGLTICKFAEWLSRDRQDPIKHYEASGIDGTNSRTIAEYTNGLVRTLTDSVDLVNQKDFYRLLNHDYSKFHLGPHIDITPEYISSEPELELFKDGFDIIHASMTFQFYHTYRDTQYFYLKRLLKEGGLALFKEKLFLPNKEEYQRREEIKDRLFKTLYFSSEEINTKRSAILDKGVGLSVGQLDFYTLVSAMKRHFKFVYLIWNSTNFYGFAASDSELTVSKFIELLPPAYVPSPFCAESNLPRPYCISPF
jgi:hypothetical protein